MVFVSVFFYSSTTVFIILLVFFELRRGSRSVISFYLFFFDNNCTLQSFNIPFCLFLCFSFKYLGGAVLYLYIRAHHQPFSLCLERRFTPEIILLHIQRIIIVKLGGWSVLHVSPIH